MQNQIKLLKYVQMKHRIQVSYFKYSSFKSSPHFLNLRERVRIFFDEADKRVTLGRTDPHQSQAIFLRPVWDCRGFAKEVSVNVGKTERLGRGPRKVQPLSSTADLVQPVGPWRKFVSFDWSPKGSRAVIGWTVRRYFVVIAYFIGAVSFEQLLHVSCKEIQMLLIS